MNKCIKYQDQKFSTSNIFRTEKFRKTKFIWLTLKNKKSIRNIPMDAVEREVGNWRRKNSIDRQVHICKRGETILISVTWEIELPYQMFKFVLSKFWSLIPNFSRIIRKNRANRFISCLTNLKIWASKVELLTDDSKVFKGHSSFSRKGQVWNENNSFTRPSRGTCKKILSEIERYPSYFLSHLHLKYCDSVILHQKIFSSFIPKLSLMETLAWSPSISKMNNYAKQHFFLDRCPFKSRVEKTFHITISKSIT